MDSELPFRWGNKCWWGKPGFLSYDIKTYVCVFGGGSDLLRRSQTTGQRNYPEGQKQSVECGSNMG